MYINVINVSADFVTLEHICGLNFDGQYLAINGSTAGCGAPASTRFPPKPTQVIKQVHLMKGEWRGHGRIVRN